MFQRGLPRRNYKSWPLNRCWETSAENERFWKAVSQLPEVLAALRTSLENPQLRDADGFHRLVSAGVMVQTAENKIAFACDLYRRYFQEHIRPPV